MLKILRQYAVSLAATIFLIVPTVSSAESGSGLRLLMIEQAGCTYCVTFNRDIAPIYAKTEHGEAAPLVHADLRHDLPEGITLASRPFVTPTFILLGPEGVEISRLTGFPGEDFFWPYIAQMIDDAQKTLPATALN